MASYESYQYLENDRSIINDLIPGAFSDDSPNSNDVLSTISNDLDDQILHQRNLADSSNLLENTQPTALTSSFPSPILTQQIEYVDHLPEYPQSHPSGHAYVVQLNTSDPGISNRNPFTSIQYSHATVGTPRQIYCSFLRSYVIKHYIRCTGVKMCQYIHPDLATMEHTNVSELVFSRMSEIRQQITQRTTSLFIHETASLYRSVVKLFNSGRACQESTLSCQAVLEKYHYPDLAGIQHYYIGCSNASPSNYQKHFHKNLANKAFQLDLDLLKRLFETGEHDQIHEPCGVIEQLNSRRPHCGVPHIQGHGKMERKDCKVTFIVLVPTSITQCPYAIFLSKGIHSHPPPPPNKPPEKIMDEILHLIKRMQNPDLTLSLFLRSPALKEFCLKYNSQTLSQIHHSFVNQDRFSAIITKERALLYPKGRSFNGVIYEHTRNPNYRNYVRRIYTDDTCTMIICGFKEQITFLKSLNSFEINMSFKRVKGDFNEVIFATFLPEHGKILTLLRVFIDQETAESYYILFRQVFQLISEVCDAPVQFHYLHQSGYRAIVVDMDGKQLSGLGHYLQEIDPEGRPWTWQLQNIIIFCRVHFMRTISKLVPSGASETNHISHTVWLRMVSLLSCQSQDEFLRLAGLLQVNESPEIARWAKHKQHPVIAAGLNKHCSLMNSEFYDKIRNHTNAVEQSHYKSYWMGVYDSLLGATLGSMIIDQRDINQFSARQMFGIHHSRRSDDMDTRYYNHMAREERRKKRRIEQEDRIDEPHSILFGASSSGFTRAPSGSRGRSNSQGRSRGPLSSRSVSRRRSTSLQSSDSSRRSMSLQQVATSNLQAQSQNNYAESRQIDLQILQAEIRKAEIEKQKLELELELARIKQTQA